MYNRILFIGSKLPGLKVLQVIHEIIPQYIVGCVTVDDSKDSRTKLQEFKNYCHNNRIALDILKGKCDLTESIKTFSPDLCVVMGWYYIIDEKLIDKVRGGFLGIHNSLLPSHRGFAPVVWSIIGGDTETGFSLFSFDKGMDTGDIWYQARVSINESDYISDIINKIDIEIEKFLRTGFIDIVYEKILPYKQGTNNISYGARRLPEDGLIKWDSPARDIYNFIRAQSKPYSGAYTFYNEKKITIWESKIFPYIIQGKPGQIGLINQSDNVVVVCGNSSGLILEKIEIDGIESPVTDIIRGLKYVLGEV